MGMMTSRHGLTLVEVMIALFILAVGVLAAFGMQANSLRGTRAAELSQTLANMGESELQLQRQFERHVTSPVTGESCRSIIGSAGFSCEVDVYPCSLVSGALTCSKTSVTDAVARQVTVRLSGPGNVRARVSTVAY